MNVIIYIVDSLRKDHVSCYGYPRQTTPNIDRIAKSGTRFDNAFATSTWTREAGTSLLTGLYPSATGVKTIHSRLPESVPTLPEILDQASFTTVGASATGHISKEFGFDRGFNHFTSIKNDENFDMGGLSGGFKFIPPSSKKLHEFVIDQLKNNDNTDFFGLIWSLDVHSPYFVKEDEVTFSDGSGFIGAPGDAKLDRLVDVYDDMIHLNDERLGDFVDELQSMGVYDDTLFILIGDHGEAFGEHGKRGHCKAPYEEQIAVPLIVDKPSRMDLELDQPEALVQTNDIFPTILEAVKIDIPEYVQGVSVFGGSREFAYSETRYRRDRPLHECIRTDESKLVHGNLPDIDDYTHLLFKKIRDRDMRGVLSVMKSGLQYISEGERWQLFDLRNDQEETADVSGSEGHSETEAMLKSYLVQVHEENDTLRDRFNSSDSEAVTVNKIDSDVERQLEDLGYKL